MTEDTILTDKAKSVSVTEHTTRRTEQCEICLTKDTVVMKKTKSARSDLIQIPF